MDQPTTEQTPDNKVSVDERMLMEIYLNTRKTKNYMKWQLIITVALVVIPLLAMLFVVPLALNSLSQVYGPAGVLQQ
jgi:hypothetical protein